MFDIAIIGAGINGCAVAYELREEKKSVALFDMGGVANGGSGAAGAFISPKFSKAGELKELLHNAFVYSMAFYEEHFASELIKAPLLHLAKDETDAAMLQAYKASTDLELIEHENESREYVSINTGLVDASGVCEAMSRSAQLIQEEVISLRYDDGVWVINESYSAKKILLATGAYKKLIDEPYLKLRGVWGHRIDVASTTHNPFSIHQFVSISPSHNGKLAIGATHNVHYHPQTATEPYDINAGREELLDKAAQTLLLEDVKVIKDYTGLRSGSFDYIPLLGRLVASKETLQNNQINFKVKRADYSEYSYYPNLYIINGSGGYGFVLAPYLARILKEHLLLGQEIPKMFHPARFFARWAKRH